MEKEKNGEVNDHNENNKKEEEKEEHVLFKENYEDVLLKNIKEIENNIENDNKIYEKELEDYFTYVMNLHQDTFDNFRKKEEVLIGMNCLKDKLQDENEDLFRLIQENKEEINSIKQEKQNYKSINNVTGVEELYRISPIEFIKKMAINEDLTMHPKFKKNIRPNIPESLVCLKSDGGKYLKNFSASIYFIELLKRRYAKTIICEKNVNSLNKYIEVDKKKDFENHIKVSYFQDDKLENFLISLRTQEKKENYTFYDLKEEACDYWGISLEERKKYHIVNEKMIVYAPQIKVYDIHKIAIKNNSTTLQFKHMELIDRISIFTERKKRAKVEGMKNMIEEDNLNIKKKEISEEEIFETELEDYVNFVRRLETIADIFKKEEPAVLKKPVINPEAKEENKEEVKEENKEEFKEDEDEEEKKRIEEERRKELLLLEASRKKKKIVETPLYITLYDIHKFRLAKFFMMLLSLTFTFSTYYFSPIDHLSTLPNSLK